jgi:starch synthase
MSAVVPLYIKTAYHDEPSFTNTKVITSLYANSLTKAMAENFKHCVEFRDATADLLKPYNDNFDFDELGKLAIDFSDGIIQADKAMNNDLLDYAAQKETPILKFKNDNFADAIEDFYNQIAPDATPDEEED